MAKIQKILQFLCQIVFFTTSSLSFQTFLTTFFIFTIYLVLLSYIHNQI